MKIGDIIIAGLVAVFIIVVVCGIIFLRLTYGCFFIQERTHDSESIKDIPCYKIKAYVEMRSPYPYVVISNGYCKNVSLNMNSNVTSYYSVYQLKDEYLIRCLEEKQ